MKTQLTLLALLTLSTLNSFAQWQQDVRLTNDPATSSTSENNAWCVASNGNVVHVVWFDDRDGNSEIYYKRSTNGGITWGADTRLTNAPDISKFPSITLNDSVVHVVWADLRNGLPNYEIYYKRSIDGGVSWGTDIRLTNNGAVSGNPSVATFGQVLHVVWEDYRDSPNGEIYHKRSTDGGVNWEADTRLTNNGAFSVLTSVAVSGQFVHVVWQDFRDGNSEIYYKRSSDGGVIWGADTRFTNNTFESSHPSVSISGQFVHVVWMELHAGNNKEIYYKRSTDGGTTWEADTRLTNDPAESWSPSISVSGQVLHVVWEDTRDGNSEIYYNRSVNGGVSWEADTRLTNDVWYSTYPSISVSGQIVHVVWQEDRNVNWEIYYKRNPTGGIPVELTSFTANVTSDGNVILNWSTATEINNSGFEIQRSRKENDFFTIGFVDGNSTTTEPQSYNYIDKELSSGKYKYRLKQVDYDGSFEYFPNEIGIEVEVLGNVQFELVQNFPNPFNPATKISYSLPTAEFVTLKVFDVLGKEVATLVNEEKPAGGYEVEFNAAKISSGMYLYILQAGSYTQTKKLILMK